MIITKNCNGLYFHETKTTYLTPQYNVFLQNFTFILVHKSQQEAQVTEFILSDNYSTCFGRHYHPHKKKKNNCNYSIW
jgi:hypothetical protein